VSPSPIQDAAPGAALVRRYALLGSFPLTIDNVVVPVSIVDDLCLGRIRYAGGQAGLGATVAEFSNVQLFNPANSGILVNCEKVLVSTDVAGSIAFKAFDTALTTNPGFTQWRDRRLPGEPAALCLTQGGAVDFGIADLFFQPFFDPADRFHDMTMNVTLLPGMGLCITASTLNRSTIVSFYWNETNLLPGD